MQFKVGDIVVIVDKLFSTKCGIRDCAHIGYNDDMSKHCNSVAIITDICLDDRQLGCYRIDLDNKCFIWHESWLISIQNKPDLLFKSYVLNKLDAKSYNKILHEIGDSY